MTRYGCLHHNQSLVKVFSAICCVILVYYMQNYTGILIPHATYTVSWYYMYGTKPSV